MRDVWLLFIGGAAGLATSAGVFSLITVIGIIPRLAGRSKTAPYIRLYEWMIIAGGELGTLQTFLNHPVLVGRIGLGLTGLGSGIFVSCLSMSLAETLDVFPILVRRTKLKMGLPWIVLAFALGKTAGAWLAFANNWNF